YAVRVHTAQIGPHQRPSPFLRHGLRNARRRKERAREALEIGAGDHVQFSFRRHARILQQIRRMSIADDLYTNGLPRNNPAVARTRTICAMSACLFAGAAALCFCACERVKTASKMPQGG